MDRLDAMWVLIEVVDAGSLSAAGRRLGIPLATVSRKVSELEAHLRTQIFVRANRRLTLTDAGRSYVDACRRILDDVSETERAAAGEYSAPRGALTIAAPIVFGRMHVTPLLADFLRTYPEIDVRVELSDRRVDFSEEHIDVALRVGALPDSSLISTKVGETRKIACASPAYLAARGIPRDLGALATHDCVTFDLLDAPDTWLFGPGNDMRAAVHTRLAVSTAEAAITAAIAGVGVTRVLDYQVAHALRAGDIARILQPFEPTPVPISLVYPAQGRMPMKLRAFIDFMTPRLKAATAEPTRRRKES